MSNKEWVHDTGGPYLQEVTSEAVFPQRKDRPDSQVLNGEGEPELLLSSSSSPHPPLSFTPQYSGCVRVRARACVQP